MVHVGTGWYTRMRKFAYGGGHFGISWDPLVPVGTRRYCNYGFRARDCIAPRNDSGEAKGPPLGFTRAPSVPFISIRRRPSGYGGRLRLTEARACPPKPNRAKAGERSAARRTNSALVRRSARLRNALASRRSTCGSRHRLSPVTQLRSALLPAITPGLQRAPRAGVLMPPGRVPKPPECWVDEPSPQAPHKRTTSSAPGPLA